MVAKWQLVLGRVLLSAIFILSGLGKLPHFHDIAGMMAAKGIPLATLAQCPHELAHAIEG